MEFNYQGINQQASLHIPQPSNYSCFNDQAPWAGYMGPDIGLIPHEFFHRPHPHPFLHPCDMRSVIQIEIEKERIREEIIISEIIARKCCLEAELMMERGLDGQRDVDGYPDGSSPEEVFESPMSLEQTNGRCESGGFDTSPFQRGSADMRIMEVKAFSEEDKENRKVINLAKPDENILGLKRKAAKQPEADTSELPLNVLKDKEEWSCALCQASATSERSLNKHLQGKKHKSKEAALTSQKAGDNYKIGPKAKKVELKAESLLVEKTGEESPTVSDNLKNQSGSIQEVQKNGDPPNPGNLGENGSGSVRETGKNGENISGPERNGVTQPEADTSELPSNVVLKVKEEWSCALSQVSASSAQGLNEYLHGKKHKSKEAALISEKAGDNYKIGLNARKLELKAKSLLVEKTGEENPTISDNLKENQSESVQEVQKNGYPPNPNNLGKNGFNAKKVEFKAKTWAESPTTSDSLKENQSGSVQEVQKNGDPPNPVNLGENGFNAKKVEFKAKTWQIKKIGVENPTISDNLKENQSGSVQEVQKNGDPPNPDNMGENGSESVQEMGKNGDPKNKKYNFWCEMYKVRTVSQNSKDVSVEDKEKPKVIDLAKLDENISGPERKTVMQPEADTSELSSNAVVKAKEEWSCALCQVSATRERGLNEHLQGKKHKSKEAALTSQKTGDSYKIGLNAKKVELKAESLLVEKSGENPTVSDNLKENQSGSVQEVQKNGNPPNRDNLGENGFNVKKVELKGKTWLIKKTRVENPTISEKLKENQSDSVQEVWKNGDPPNPGNLGENGFNAKKVELKPKTWLIKKTGLENPTISDNLKENLSESVQEVQKNGDPPNPDNLGETGSESVQETRKNDDLNNKNYNFCCEMYKVGVHEHMQGKKRECKEVALTSQKAGKNYKIGLNANKVEFKAKTCLIKKTGEENPTISDNLKEYQSGSVQEVQINVDPPNPKNKKYNFWCEMYKVRTSSQKSKAVSVENKKPNVIDLAKLDENISGPERKALMQPEADTSELPSDIVLKAIEEWSCALCQVSAGSERGLNEHLQGKKHKSKEAALTSQKAGDDYKIGLNAKKEELKAESLLVEKIGEENPTISDNLKDNQSGSVQEVQKNGDPSRIVNLGENGFNAKKVEFKAKTWLIKKTGVENPTISDSLKENQSGSVQELQKNGDPPNPNNLGKNGFNAKKVELKATNWVIKKTGVEKPTISDNLKESLSESVHEVQKNGDPPNPDSLGGNGSESVQETGKNGDPRNKKYNFCSEMCKVRTFSQKAKAVSVEDRENPKVIDLAKLDENIFGLERMAVTQSEADTSEITSNVVLKAKEKWSCALCQVSNGSERGLNEHLQGKKHKSNEAALTSQKAGDNYKIGHNAKKVELKAESLLVEKTGVENPTISDNVKENQSESVQEVQKNGDPPSPNNLGKNGFNSKKVEFKAKTWQIKKTGVEKPTISDNLKENQSESVQEVQKNGDPPNPNYLEKNGFNAKKVEFKATTWVVKKTGVKKPTFSDNLKESLSESVQEVQKNGNPPNPDNIGGNGSESVQETGKNGDPKNRKYNFWCEMCKVGTISQKDMNEHEVGKKHVNRVRKSDWNGETGLKIKIWLKEETKMEDRVAKDV